MIQWERGQEVVQKISSSYDEVQKQTNSALVDMNVNSLS